VDTETHTYIYSQGNGRGKESTLCFSLYHRLCHPPVCHSRLDYVGLLRLFSSLLHRTTIHSSNARVPISVVLTHTQKPARIFLGGIIFLKSIRFASVGFYTRQAAATVLISISRLKSKPSGLWPFDSMVNVCMGIFSR
jgi:hypothetical protein